MDIQQLQAFADERHMNINVAHAFAALDPDTTYRSVGGMEHIEPATPAEIAWASANVRPLVPNDPLFDEQRKLSREQRWRNSARALGVFTPTTLRQHVIGSDKFIKPMLQRMLAAGEIECVRQYERFVCPATYRWIGDGDLSAPDNPPPAPPRAESPEERWRNAARSLGVFSKNILRSQACGAKQQAGVMVNRMLAAGEIEEMSPRIQGRNGSAAMYRWIGGNGSPPPTCR